MAQQRIAFTVHGKVQGVFFRAFTVEKASSYDLTGFVYNTNDDKVKGEAQGSSDDIKKLIKDINEGPKHAHVVRVEQEDIDVQQGESGFDQR